VLVISIIYYFYILPTKQFVCIILYGINPILFKENKRFRKNHCLPSLFEVHRESPFVIIKKNPNSNELNTLKKESKNYPYYTVNENGCINL